MKNLKVICFFCALCIALHAHSPADAFVGWGTIAKTSLKVSDFVIDSGKIVIKTTKNVWDDISTGTVKAYRATKTWFGFADEAANASKFRTLGKLPGAVSNSQIDELAKLPVEEAGKRIGKLKLGAELLEDTYLRILVKQGKISSSYADELLENLNGVDGFTTTMRKVSSANPAQVSGHLYELGIANEAAKGGFKVVAIGKKFSDPAKRGLTDLDLVISKGGKNYLIEAKSYTDVTMSSLPNFRADMDSLIAFGEGQRFFVISNPPSDMRVLALLEEAAKSRGVQLIFGDPQKVIQQIA